MRAEEAKLDRKGAHWVEEKSNRASRWKQHAEIWSKPVTGKILSPSEQSKENRLEPVTEGLTGYTEKTTGKIRGPIELSDVEITGDISAWVEESVHSFKVTRLHFQGVWVLWLGPYTWCAIYGKITCAIWWTPSYSRKRLQFTSTIKIGSESNSVTYLFFLCSIDFAVWAWWCLHKQSWGQLLERPWRPSEQSEEKRSGPAAVRTCRLNKERSAPAVGKTCWS